MRLQVVLLLVNVLGGVFAVEDLICMKNHTVVETSGDAVLSDTDYGPECNISSPKSIQEVATALFVVQNLNKLEYVPGVTIGLRLYDTCNDRISVYKQALVSAMEMGCSAHYDLGILAPERYFEVLEPLRSLDVLPVHTYAPPQLNFPLVDVLVDFVSGRYATVDLLLSSSRPILDRFLNVSKEAGICVRSDKELEEDGNSTEMVVVALGDYEDVTGWLDAQEEFGDEGDRRVWIVLPLDNSHVDDLLPEGSFIIKPEQFHVDLGQDLDTADVLQQVPMSTIVHSPHLLSVGKAIVEIARILKELQSKSCPFDSSGGSCALPRFEYEERQPMSNADLYETLRIPAKSHSTRYVASHKLDGALVEVTAYQIDATSARYRVIAEKEFAKVPRLCLKKLSKACQRCINFLVQEDLDENVDEDEALGTLKPYVWVPIFLTIVSCGTLACLVVLIFVVYRYFVEDILDGNPSLTIVLILATIMMLQSIVPFCLQDKTMGEEHLNARKIYVSSLSFGLAFSVMLTRALFLAFSTGGVFTSQHINGYLQGLMLFFMAGVEVAISTMYFAMSDGDSARVARSPLYIALLSYDIFLLTLLFAVCIFTAQIHRNYHEGMCFFGTSIGMLICWAVWLTCFFLMSADKRDVIVCYGILGTACLIIVGILVPRTYFMCAHFTREKDFAGRFEPTDLGPDPRMNTTARQSRQPLYEYVSTGGGGVQHQQQQQQPLANYYGSSAASPSRRFALRHRSPEPRRTPGYNNYGFRPEMRELEGAYVIPRLYVEDSDVSRAQQSSLKSIGATTRTSQPSQQQPQQQQQSEARYTLVRKGRGQHVRRHQSGELDQCVETEVYVQDRLSPSPRGPDERYPRRSGSPRLSPTHATICEEEESERSMRITRF